MTEGVFLDLDGTLADTAPDLVSALNSLLLEHGRDALPHEFLRPHVSAGTRGMLLAGFAAVPNDAEYPALQKRFLDLYEISLCSGSRLFDGMAGVLDELEARDIRWGVVTNKPERFTLPLMEALGLAKRAAAIVSGDTTPKAKPDPLPLLHACHLAGVSPQACIYVGDDQRDIEAGRAAGMRTLAATWGYLGTGLPVGEWGADEQIGSPAEIIADIARSIRPGPATP